MGVPARTTRVISGAYPTRSRRASTRSEAIHCLSTPASLESDRCHGSLSASRTHISVPICACSRFWRHGPGLPSSAFRAPATLSAFQGAAGSWRDGNRRGVRDRCRPREFRAPVRMASSRRSGEPAIPALCKVATSLVGHGRSAYPILNRKPPQKGGQSMRQEGFGFSSTCGFGNRFRP